MSVGQAEHDPLATSAGACGVPDARSAKLQSSDHFRSNIRSASHHRHLLGSMTPPATAAQLEMAPVALNLGNLGSVGVGGD
jgi:hypothetical protein